MRDLLNPEKALIFRITHRDNLPWIFANGLHCRNSNRTDSTFISIGNPDLISRRHHHPVRVPPGGTLGDYIPFYFTPFSMMLYNIRTGYRGIRQRANEEIVFVISSLRKLQDDQITFIFTDRHAYLETALSFTNLNDLNKINWQILQNRDFRRDPENPQKTEQYQAEALVYRYLPVGSLLGVGCYNTVGCEGVRRLAEREGVNTRIVSRPEWYFQ